MAFVRHRPALILLRLLATLSLVVAMMPNGATPVAASNLHQVLQNRHDNPVETTTTVHLLFFLPPTLQDSTPTSLSASYVNTVEQLVRDIGGTGLYGILTQYGVKNKVTYGGATAATSGLPSSCLLNTNCISDTTVHSALSDAIAANGWSTGLAQTFLVYLPPGESVCKNFGLTDCYPAGGCRAYHDHFDSSGDVVYGVIPYEKCTFGPYSQDVNTAVSFSSHELMEMVTDPDLNAWQDSSGKEIGDLCASDAGLQPGIYDYSNANQKLHGHYYEVQTEWSNRDAGCVRNDGKERLADVTTSSGVSAGPPGVTVYVGAEDFLPGETVTVTYSTGLKSPDTTALCAPSLAGSTAVRGDPTEQDDGGAAKTDTRTAICQSQIPSVNAGPFGPHTITVTGNRSGRTAKTTFTLTQPTKPMVMINADDNIWGAGLSTPPDPGGGGGGERPVDVKLPGSGSVSLSNVTGTISCCSGASPNGADGAAGGTNISGYGGLSGITDSDYRFYLVGVFLSRAQPSIAPPTLDFTGNHDFASLTPQLGQVFFIGDGLARFGYGPGQTQTFVIPSAATDLYLGIPDALGFSGNPGYYADNTGSLTATLAISP